MVIQRSRCRGGFLSRRLGFLVLLPGVAGGLVLPGPLRAGDTDFFESRIRPILVEQCQECHSKASGKAKGGLELDTREGIRKGGEGGPAVVPGDVSRSRLITAISHEDPDLTMPPKKPRLSDAVIEDFRTWIKAGAPDPRETSPGATTVKPPVSLEAGREFWAFRKPLRPDLPQAGNSSWAISEIDRLVEAGLETAGLAPSPDATPPVLLRRLHFDLVGLPPRPVDIVNFTQDVSQRGWEPAMERVVDALLASDRFGERWGRHWLDVARFAESSGRESNLTFPHAWRYRDYVIAAFNVDLPFDRFLTEQLAGDLLPAANAEERARLLIATGFLAMGTKGLNEMNRKQFEADLVDEQIDTVTRAILAQSVACARCHDHKFDPFHMRDYYALAGIFGSTRTFFGTAIGSENNVGGDLIRLPDLPGQVIPNPPLPKAKVAAMKAQVAALNREEQEGQAAVRAAIEKGENPGERFTLADALRILWTRGGLEGQLKTVDEEGRALPLCMGVQDLPEAADAPLLERGEITKRGALVPRGFPRVIVLRDPPTVGAHDSGRLALAHWLTHPDQPLTSRVMANRVWRHLLGKGLVLTTDNFGFTGEMPSHPALLDLLAVTFVENGWSVKSLVRRIVLSHTYRQNSDWREEAFLRDPDNRLLWRANKRRLEAECIRDAMLSVSGLLDLTPRKGSLVAGLGDKSVSLFGFTQGVPSDLDGSLHRSVYLPVVRDRLPDVLDLFDFAEPGLVTGNRDTTNVPMQALYLMNSPFVREQAGAFAKRLGDFSPDLEDRIRQGFYMAFGRGPDDSEHTRIREFLSRLPDGSALDAEALLCQVLLSSAEFRNLD